MGVERSRRIATRTPRDEPYDVPQLFRPKLGRDLVDAPLVEQQDSGYDRLGHSLRDGPSHRRWIERDCVGICHGANIFPKRASRITSAEAAEQLR